MTLKTILGAIYFQLHCTGGHALSELILHGENGGTLDNQPHIHLIYLVGIYWDLWGIIIPF